MEGTGLFRRRTCPAPQERMATKLEPLAGDTSPQNKYPQSCKGLRRSDFWRETLPEHGQLDGASTYCPQRRKGHQVAQEPTRIPHQNTEAFWFSRRGFCICPDVAWLDLVFISIYNFPAELSLQSYAEAMPALPRAFQGLQWHCFHCASTLYCEGEMLIQETGLSLLFLGGEGEAQQE